MAPDFFSTMHFLSTMLTRCSALRFGALELGGTMGCLSWVTAGCDATAPVADQKFHAVRKSCNSLEKKWGQKLFWCFHFPACLRPPATVRPRPALFPQK